MKKKNKNGFVASSIMFSFFLVFISLAALVLAAYAHYRILMGNMNGSILTDLNDNVISKKYIKVYNAVSDGNFRSIKEDLDFADGNYTAFERYWTTTDSYPESLGNDYYVAMRKKGTNANLSFSQNLNGKIPFGENKKIFLGFKHRRTYDNTCDGEQFKVILKINNTEYTYDKQPLACGVNPDAKISGWSTYYEVFDVNVNSDIQSLEFIASNVKQNESGSINIKDVMIVDVTDFYTDSSLNTEEIDRYLGNKIPFFEENYVIPKL